MHASLGFIGRAQMVDSEDLPEDDNCKLPVINSENHKTVVSLLSEKTISLYFFQRSFLRFNLPNKSFICNHNVNIEHNIHKIVVFNRQLHELELQNFMAIKLSEFYNLIMQITRLIMHEHMNLKLARNDLPHESRLECLRGFCESLRICFNNIWSLFSFVQANNDIVTSCTSRYRQSLVSYAGLYQLLTTRTIQLSQEFVSNGLLVLSHSDLLKYTHDDLWEIARGVEEYNIVVEQTLFHKRSRLLWESYLEVPRVHGTLNSINEQMDQQISGIRTMSFGKILYKLASERSLLIAHSVHNFFYNSSIIAPQIARFLHSFGFQNSPILHFHEGLFEFEQCLRTMKQAGSPVNDFLRLEYEFTSNFLDIISQSTEMLKELSGNIQKKKLRKEDTQDNFMAPNSTTSNGKCSLFGVKKACERRKGVQWSDDTDVSLRHQVIGRYLIVVWKLVNDLLLQAKYNNRYRSIVDPSKGLGSWLLLSMNCRKIIGIIVERIAKPDVFPVGFVPILVHQAEVIEYENLLLLWDQGMCTSVLLNCDTPSTSQVLLDDVSEISAMIYRYLLSQSKQLKLNNSKATDQDKVDVTATILSVGLYSLLKCGEKLTDLVTTSRIGQDLRDLSELLWPLIAEWALMETYFIDHGYVFIEDPSFNLPRVSLLLAQSIPNFIVGGTMNKLKKDLLEDYKTRCTERVYELLDIDQMQRSLSMDSHRISAQNLTPSAYVQGAILGVLELLHRSIIWQNALSMQEALSITIEVFCASWLRKIEFLSTKNGIFDPSQLQLDVSLVREWINSKENIPDPMKSSLLHLDFVINLENHVSKLQPMTRGIVEHDSRYLQRQTSELGLKVVKGCTRLCEDICSKTRNSADTVIQAHPTVSHVAHKKFSKLFPISKSDKR